ncbi:HalOD1 output domain-containing protein [Natrinema altunense]|uniref:Halobacterial output domain-containing protein n=1 Tax=Natrinema altunense TaxID=222984 RepID=A0A482XYD6_9EURY|nr:HalOD1 output domain-containing protein [Natrinema altunense]RZH68779.1 hypothetical protein ELS17_04775 [Natrinema altunense]
MPPTDDPSRRDSDFVTTFEPADERPSTAVVTAVAVFRDVPPIELSPLYDAVDPDALDAVVEHAQRVDEGGTHRVWFTYEGAEVGVRSDGEIRVRDTA